MLISPFCIFLYASPANCLPVKAEAITFGLFVKGLVISSKVFLDSISLSSTFFLAAAAIFPTLEMSCESFSPIEVQSTTDVRSDLLSYPMYVLAIFILELYHQSFAIAFFGTVKTVDIVDTVMGLYTENLEMRDC